jgi:hypothetical protein
MGSKTLNLQPGAAVLHDQRLKKQRYKTATMQAFRGFERIYFNFLLKTFCHYTENADLCSPKILKNGTRLSGNW